MTSPAIIGGGGVAAGGTAPPPPVPPSGAVYGPTYDPVYTGFRGSPAALSLSLRAAATGTASTTGGGGGAARPLSFTASAAGTFTSLGGTNFAAAPSAHGYPDATNTGAILGALTALSVGTPTSGAGWSWDGNTLTISGGGAVFANFSVPGTVVINGVNAVMRNCKVITSGFNSNGITIGANGVLVDHCTVQGTDALSGGLDAGIKTAGGSRSFTSTIDSCNIFNSRSGCQDLAGTVQNSFIHDLRHASGDHINGLTQNGGTTPLTVKHNTIFCAFDQTDAVGLFSDFGVEGNDTVTDNILAGGGYTIYGGAGGPNNSDPLNVKITNNRISDKYFPQGGFFGWIAYTGSAARGNVTSGNIWDATGALIAGQ